PRGGRVAARSMSALDARWYAGRRGGRSLVPEALPFRGRGNREGGARPTRCDGRRQGEEPKETREGRRRGRGGPPPCGGVVPHGLHGARRVRATSRAARRPISRSRAGDRRGTSSPSSARDGA